jgi:hypothetical protein
MKTKLKYILSFILLIIIASCSDKPAENTISAITISVNQNNINLGESFTFSVVDNTGKSVQSGLVIYVNSVAISGTSYTPSTEGTFSVYAKYKDIVSNNLNLGVTKLPPSAITVTLSRNTISIGQSVNFEVKDNYGSAVTSQAEIFVNTVKIMGDNYSPTEKGSYEVYARFGQLESDKQIFKVYQFVQKALIEDYTGTWCGWCPRVVNAIELVLAETDDVIPVAIHSTSGSAVDPFNFDNKSILFSTFGVSGYPTAKINRTETWEYPENTPPGVYQVISKLATEASLGLGISSVSKTGTLDIEIQVGFAQDQSDLKLVVYLLEDKLRHTQANYTDLYGGASTLPNFEHNHVLRHCLTDLLGDEIPSSESKVNNVYSRTFNFTTADSEIQNPSNVRVVAFVVDGSTKKVINVQEAAINESSLLFI